MHVFYHAILYFIKFVSIKNWQWKPFPTKFGKVDFFVPWRVSPFNLCVCPSCFTNKSESPALPAFDVFSENDEKGQLGSALIT